MNNDRKKHIKVFYLVLGFILICSLFMLIYVNIKNENKNEKLLEEKGIITEASILSITQYKANRKSRSKCYVELAFFADTSVTELSDSLSLKKNMTGDEVVKYISNLNSSLRKPFGKYTTVKLPINMEQYNRYNVNDKVKIKYVKDQPEIVKLIN